MDENDYFVIYELELDSYNQIGHPFVIITVCDNQKHCFSETFILFPEKYNINTPEPIDIPVPKLAIQKDRTANLLRDTEFQIDNIQSFMESQTLEQVYNRIKTTFYDVAKRHDIKYENWHKIKLEKKSKERLVYLWMSGQCKKELRNISNQTECEVLNEYLQKVMRLPQVIVETEENT